VNKHIDGAIIAHQQGTSVFLAADCDAQFAVFYCFFQGAAGEFEAVGLSETVLNVVGFVKQNDIVGQVQLHLRATV
jgi:hypothetical protein